MLIYIPIAVYILIRVVRKRQTAKSKWLAGVVTVFLLYLPLGWDVILGRAYFYYLCSTQGGVHVYKTVKLGPEYWDQKGSPLFITERGGFDEGKLKYNFSLKIKGERGFNELFNVGKYSDILLNTPDNRILGEKIFFIYFGGWFINHTGFHVKGEVCHGYRKGLSGGLYNEFLSKIFILK